MAEAKGRQILGCENGYGRNQHSWSLNYFIANADLVSTFDAYDPIGDFQKELEENLPKMFNIAANIHLYSLFIPLILKAQVKKVAALNTKTAKSNALYKKDGVLFLSLCPGMADMGHQKDDAPDQLLTIISAIPEQMERLGGLLKKFLEYAPHFTDPATSDVAVKDLVAV
ncbi:hypothetical protein F4818DRAFT_445496 [Hypoxylon cercidicola]|nr:hypothetical protein F4818DRAFT_445496 [Hypoxylon cercidicola]